MEKHCTRMRCNEILTWEIDGNRLTGFCPIHGHVCGTFRDRPLTKLGKKLLNLRGYKFREATIRYAREEA